MLSEKSENIVLDVTLSEMINTCAFRAVLDNGHQLVAYRSSRNNRGDNPAFRVGERAMVFMSPYDMSRGELLDSQDVRS